MAAKFYVFVGKRQDNEFNNKVSKKTTSYTLSVCTDYIYVYVLNYTSIYLFYFGQGS